MVKVKICGLFRQCDIDYVNEAMPDYAGFVFAKSRRQVEETEALALRERLRPEILPVGVFVNPSSERVETIFRAGTIDVVQLHGDETPEFAKGLKEKLEMRMKRKIPVIKAISSDLLLKQEEEIVQGRMSRYQHDETGEDETGLGAIEKLLMEYMQAGVDYFLFDSGKGGTGSSFDWSLIPKSRRPFFLAGGMGLHNVEEAIEKTAPYCIDLSSSVETQGVKDREKILQVVRLIRSADQGKRNGGV